MDNKPPLRTREDSIKIQDITPDHLFAPSEIYHENSKYHLIDRMLGLWIHFVNTSPQVRQIISRSSSHYRGYPSTTLPRKFAPTPYAFEKVIVERRSVRTFSGAPMSLNSLAKILYLGDGIVAHLQTHDGTEWPLRTAPSGGGLYPIDLYCIPLRVTNLIPGIYFYNPSGHCLERLLEQDLTQALVKASRLEETVRQACVCIVMTAVFPRNKFKYGERGYRFALLEAGHIAQNLLLAAQAEGLGAVPIGGFVDDQLNQILNLDGVQEAVLYFILIGCLDPKP